MNVLYKVEWQFSILRILFFGVLLLIIVDQMGFFVAWAHFPKEFWNPNGIFQLFDVPVFNSGRLKGLVMLWGTTSLLSCIGLFYRVTGPLCLLSGLLVVNNAHNFGYQGHVYMPLMLLTLPLAFSRANEKISLDAFLFRKTSPELPSVNEMAYFNMKLIFCLVFFMAGLSKLINSGLDWIFTDTLRNYFFRGIFYFTDSNPYITALPLGKYLYQYPKLCHGIAGLTIFIEIFCPLSLFSRKWMLFFIPSLLVMQIASVFTIGVIFKPYVLMYLIWVPELLRFMGDLKSRGPKLAPACGSEQRPRLS